MSLNETVKDRLQRPLRDLRISLTDQCNFRCAYCMPKEIFGPNYAFLAKEEMLSNEEIGTLVDCFVALGVEKIRLTGGEPLLRPNVSELIAQLSLRHPELDLSLTTNGSLLPRYAKALKDAGLKRINISFDSLNPETAKLFNGRELSPQRILDAIDLAIECGLSAKVNMVVKRGVNENEILDMAATFKAKGVTLRFIEYMDVGNTNQWKLDEVVTAKQILEILESQNELWPIEPNYIGEVAKRYRYADGAAEIGIVSSVSKPFCGDCHRARLSADGKLFTCLFASQGADLRKRLRDGVDCEALIDFISTIWLRRDDRYSEERASLANNNKAKQKIEMSYIGG